MNYYRVLGTSAAPSCLVGTQADAKALARERGTSWEEEEVPDPKGERMAYVNRLLAAIHAEMHREGSGDLAEREADNEPLTTAYTGPLVPAPSYASQSIQLDEDFDKLPLARQLDLAARAMENARLRL